MPLAAVAATFLSNVREGLLAATGVRRAGRSARHAFGLHGAVAADSALAALVGFAVSRGVALAVVAAMRALAAGAILAMLADTRMPEAHADAHATVGLASAAGFPAAFALTELGA